MNYTYFDVQNASGDVANILLYDRVGVDKNEKAEGPTGISGRRFAEELYALAQRFRRINVRINSPGGRVSDGLSICAAILNINKSVKGVRIDTYVDGLALSIAGLIAVCGKRVYMCNFAQLMLHNPFVSKESADQANPGQATEQHQALYQIKEMLLTLLATRTGLSTEILSAMMNQTTWLSAEVAQKHGFVDEVFDHPKKKTMAGPLAEAANDEAALFEVFNAYPVDFNNEDETSHQSQFFMSKTPSQGAPTVLSAEEIERLRNEAVSFRGDLSAISNACGLPNDSNRESILSHINAQVGEIKRLKTLELSIDNFQTNIANLEQKNQKLEEQLAEMKKYEADNLIESAIREGKIAPAKKQKWLNHAYDNYEMVRDTLADMPVHPALASKVNAMGFGGSDSHKNNAGFEQLTFSELSNQHPEKLELIKNENPEVYKALFRKEYGTEPGL